MRSKRHGNVGSDCARSADLGRCPFDNLICSQGTEFGGHILSTASPSLENVFEQCCDMDASLAERLATFAEAVRTQRPAFGDPWSAWWRNVRKRTCRC